jgi:hypothetical protein
MIRTTLATLAILAAGCSGSTDSLTAQGQPLDDCQPGTSQACVQGNHNVGAQACIPGEHGYVWGACDAAACASGEQACTTVDGEAGIAACQGGRTVSACGVIGDCHPGQTSSVCPGNPCKLMGDTWAFATCGGGSSTVAGTPLVIAFHGEKVSFTRAEGAFDVFGAGASIGSSWVGAATPWLALDRNGNGSIDDGGELFGSMTELPTGERAANGFIALAALDADGDGWITRADPEFRNLVLWRDADQNRQSSQSELTSVEDAGLVAIELEYRSAPRCEKGDCEIERAHVRFHDEAGADRSGDVVDVHFVAR